MGFMEAPRFPVSVEDVCCALPWPAVPEFIATPYPGVEGVNYHAAKARESPGAIDFAVIAPDWPADSADVTVAGQIMGSSSLLCCSSPSCYKFRPERNKMATGVEDACAAAAPMLPEHSGPLPELDPACLLAPLPSDDDTSWGSAASDLAELSRPNSPEPSDRGRDSSSGLSLSPGPCRSSSSDLALSTGGSTSPDWDPAVSTGASKASIPAPSKGKLPKASISPGLWLPPGRDSPPLPQWVFGRDPDVMQLIKDIQQALAALLPATTAATAMSTAAPAPAASTTAGPSATATSPAAPTAVAEAAVSTITVTYHVAPVISPITTVTPSIVVTTTSRDVSSPTPPRYRYPWERKGEDATDPTASY